MMLKTTANTNNSDFDEYVAQIFPFSMKPMISVRDLDIEQNEEMDNQTKEKWTTKQDEDEKDLLPDQYLPIYLQNDCEDILITISIEEIGEFHAKHSDSVHSLSKETMSSMELIRDAVRNKAMNQKDDEFDECIKCIADDLESQIKWSRSVLKLGEQHLKTLWTVLGSERMQKLRILFAKNSDKSEEDVVRTLMIIERAAFCAYLKGVRLLIEGGRVPLTPYQAANAQNAAEWMDDNEKKKLPSTETEKEDEALRQLLTEPFKDNYVSIKLLTSRPIWSYKLYPDLGCDPKASNNVLSESLLMRNENGNGVWQRRKIEKISQIQFESEFHKLMAKMDDISFEIIRNARGKDWSVYCLFYMLSVWHRSY